MNTVFWLFKKEILKQRSQSIGKELFCFQFMGDTGNYGYIDYKDVNGTTLRLDGNFNYLEIVSVSGISIVGHSDNFTPTTCY